MLTRHHPDRIRIAFDDHRLVTNAGLLLPATRALRLGLPQLVDRDLDPGCAPGPAFLLSVWTGQYRRPSGAHHADLGLRSLGPTVRRGLHHQRRRRTAPRTAALKCGL